MTSFPVLALASGVALAAGVVAMLMAGDDPREVGGDSAESSSKDLGNSRSANEIRKKDPLASLSDRPKEPSTAKILRETERDLLREAEKQIVKNSTTRRAPAPVPSVYLPMKKRARNVQTYATNQVEQLSAKLNLTPEQEEKIFEIYVKSSQAYDPTMEIVSREDAREDTSNGASSGRGFRPGAGGASSVPDLVGGVEASPLIEAPSPESTEPIDEALNSIPGGDQLMADESGTRLEEQDPLAPTLNEAIADVLDEEQAALYDEILAAEDDWWGDLIEDVVVGDTGSAPK